MERSVAIYLRSSLEQNEESRNINNPDESDTIANQRKYLREYAVSKGFAKEQLVEYVDDGHTGTNFSRPAFQQLLSDIESGLIRTIIVKDFSRLGRDYIGVGEYVEQFFPLHSVRIISVNDGWDSDEHVGETMELDASFRTIIYEMYSRDLSNKLKSANRARNKKGIFSSGYVPCGYKKIPGDAHSIVIDEDYAPIVRRVFSLYNSGMTIGNIVKLLTDEGVPTPAMSKNDSHTYDNIVVDRGVWPASAVRKILRNEMYTGTLILHRFEINEFKGHCVQTDESEWLRFPNNHEAIISKEDFDKANSRLARRKCTKPSQVKKKYPVYCGHCGLKLRRTTRNENTFICGHGNKVPADSCGQIEVRAEKMEEVLLKAVNQHAQVLLEETKTKKVPTGGTKKLEREIAELSEEQQHCHDERMSLYSRFKAGGLDRDVFLERKTAVLNREEECMTELEDAKTRLDEVRKTQEFYAVHENRLREYTLMTEYDEDVVKGLIDGAYFYNDGHISIKWNFESEFGSTEDEASGEVDVEVDGEKIVAIYTSELFVMPESDADNDRAGMERMLTSYAKKQLGVLRDQLAVFSDSKEDDKLFYREGYMKFIDAGRSGRVDTLLIRSFRDLYLSNQQMNNLMFWVLPKLDCRLIAVADRFDTATATEQQYREMFEKYRSVRRNDQMKYRKWETDQGLRKPRIFIHCNRLFGYRIEEDGCYAVPEIIEAIKKIYDLCEEHHNLAPAYQWLNAEGIPTPKAFFIEQGYKYAVKLDPVWNLEKVWGVIKRKGYVEYCRHYEKCMELGRHCDKKPIVDREIFDDLYVNCRYRERHCD